MNNKILFEDIYSSKGSKIFKCTYDDIEMAAIKFNALLIDNKGHATLNDWYDCLGIENSSIGDQLEFVTVDNKPIQVYMNITLTDNNGIVCCVGLGTPFREYDEDEGGNYLMYPFLKEANNDN